MTHAQTFTYVDLPTGSECVIAADHVSCLGTYRFTNPSHQIAVVTASGAFQWGQGTTVTGSLTTAPVDQPVVSGQTYHISGWTVAVGGDATTFTNDASGHGMTVGIADAPPF